MWKQILKAKYWSMRLGWIATCVAKKMFERKQRAGIKLRSPILRWLEDAEND
jgi:hypothetical protein